MNTYTLTIPLSVAAGNMDAASATKLAKTIAYLFAIKESSNTVTGLFPTPDGGTTAINAICTFMTSKRLPNDLDAGTEGLNGISFNKPLGLSNPVPRLFLSSNDYQASDRVNNLLKPYPVVGDAVAFISEFPLDQNLSSKLVLVENQQAGDLGFYVGINSSTAIDGVYQAPYAQALGFALIGPPRSAAYVGGTTMDNTKGTYTIQPAPVRKQISAKSPYLVM